MHCSFPAMTQQILQGFAELGELKLESFLGKPLGNDVATVECELRVGVQQEWGG
jgi:hypothetical protein